MVLLLMAVPLRVGHAAAEPAPLFGVASGNISEPGALVPLGGGRFAVQDRVYSGQSIGGSLLDEWAMCFSGRFTSLEHWALDAPGMAGTHRATLTIHSERGRVALHLDGRIQFPTTAGRWELGQVTGACASLGGAGSYSGTFASTSPAFRLTLQGQLRIP